MNEFVVVYSAEFMRRIKSRPFQIGLLLGVLGVVAFTMLPSWIGGMFGGSDSIVLAGPPALTARAKPLLENGDFTVKSVVTQTSAPTAADLRTHDAGSWVTISEDASGLRVVAYTKDSRTFTPRALSRELLPLNLELRSKLTESQAHSLLTVPVSVKNLTSRFNNADQANAATAVAYSLLLLLYLLIMVNSQLIMSSVAEEKTSRIAELLVSSVSPVALLYGKIAAATTLGLLQMAVWVSVGIIAGSSSAASISSSATTAASSGMSFNLTSAVGGSVSTMEVVAFFIFFVLGFLQMATMFAGIGALINRTEDLGSISFPVVMPVLAGFLIAIAALGDPNTPLIVATSFIPLLSPFVMFARVAVSEVPVWQVVISMVLNAVALWIIAILAGKLYRVGMLLYGRPPKFRQIWSVLRS